MWSDVGPFPIRQHATDSDAVGPPLGSPLGAKRQAGVKRWGREGKTLCSLRYVVMSVVPPTCRSAEEADLADAQIGDLGADKDAPEFERSGLGASIISIGASSPASAGGAAVPSFNIPEAIAAPELIPGVPISKATLIAKIAALNAEKAKMESDLKAVELEETRLREQIEEAIVAVDSATTASASADGDAFADRNMLVKAVADREVAERLEADAAAWSAASDKAAASALAALGKAREAKKELEVRLEKLQVPA